MLWIDETGVSEGNRICMPFHINLLLGNYENALYVYVDFFFFFLLYNTVLVLPYIDMNPPQVYMSSQPWTPLPPPSPYHLSGSSQMRIPDHLTCLLRNLYAGQEATVRIRHGTMNWFKIEKGVCQGCILPPCFFNLYAEYIMRNNGLDESQAGIKISWRNINNLRYADDTTVMAES